MPKVIVTRPLEQAQSLAQAIAAIGRETVIFPLLDIQPIEDPRELIAAFEMLECFALVVFISPNAIIHGFRHLQTDWPAAVPIGVIGEGSRHALLEQGIDPAQVQIVAPRDATRADSESLLAALDLVQLAGKRVLIVRGNGGRELLAETLVSAGAQVHHVSAYRRRPPDWTSTLDAQLKSLLRQNNDWVVTSSQALRILGERIERLELSQQDVHCRFYVSHPRIAATARQQGFHDIVFVPPGDTPLFAALQCCP